MFGYLDGLRTWLRSEPRPRDSLTEPLYQLPPLDFQGTSAPPNRSQSLLKKWSLANMRAAVSRQQSRRLYETPIQESEVTLAMPDQAHNREKLENVDGVSLSSYNQAHYSNGEERQAFDVENTAYSSQSENEKDTVTPDPNLVTWDGDLDPESPLNWPQHRKWIVTWLVSCFTFVSPLASTMIAPALDDIADELDIRSDFLEVFVMSIFLLGYAFGPFVIGPMSEIFGRTKVLQISNAWFLIFNFVCGFARNKGQLLAFRFLSGIGGSAPQAIGNGILADVWRKEERGRGSSVYGLMTWLGPAVGPIVGAFCTYYTTWRWVFWATSIFDLAIQALAIVFLRETYAPKLLRDKAQRLRLMTGDHRYYTPEELKTFSEHMRKALVRPFVMLFTQPAIITISFYRAFFYGVMYLVLSTFSSLWVETYDWPVHIASLPYLSLGLGFFIGLGVAGPAQDWLYARLKAVYGTDEGVPEYRIPPLIIGTILSPVGILWYGWAAEAHTHWFVPNMGAVIFAAGLIIIFQCAQNYLIDAYTKHAASAAGAAAFVRTMAGFSFPLFAPQMYDALGVGWGNTLMAGISLFLGMPAAAALWFYGARIRARSTYCAG